MKDDERHAVAIGAGTDGGAEVWVRLRTEPTA
jgi:hypothetical protein